MLWEPRSQSQASAAPPSVDQASWVPHGPHKETKDPDCSSAMLEVLRYIWVPSPPDAPQPPPLPPASAKFPVLAPIASPPTLCTPFPQQSRAMCEGGRCHPPEMMCSRSSHGVAGSEALKLRKSCPMENTKPQAVALSEA